MNNPYVTEIKKIGDGIFIQVNDSYFDCLTPKGEQRLVNATKAMPPIRDVDDGIKIIDVIDSEDDFDDKGEIEED